MVADEKVGEMADIMDRRIVAQIEEMTRLLVIPAWTFRSWCSSSTAAPNGRSAPGRQSRNS